MVTKSRKQHVAKKAGRVKVGKMQLNKETVKDLTAAESKKIQGGLVAQALPCRTTRR